MADSSRFFSGLIVSGSFDGNDLGLLGNTVELTTAIETVDLVAGASRTPYSTLIRSIKYQVRFSMAEYTLANLAIVVAQPSTNVGSTGSYLLATTDGPDSGILIIVVNNENPSKTWTITCPNAKPSGSDPVTFDKENQGFLQVTFDANADSNGHPWQVVES